MRIQFFTLLTIFAIFQLSAQVVPAKPNFIFIVVDDLNDYTQGLNGNPEVQTPNINELESMGISFVNAYVNTPGCARTTGSIYICIYKTNSHRFQFINIRSLNFRIAVQSLCIIVEIIHHNKYKIRFCWNYLSRKLKNSKNSKERKKLNSHLIFFNQTI